MATRKTKASSELVRVRVIVPSRTVCVGDVVCTWGGEPQALPADDAERLRAEGSVEIVSTAREVAPDGDG